MRRTTSDRARVRRRVLASVCAIVVASASALGGAIGADIMAARAAIPSIDGRDVFTVTDGEGEPGDLFLTDSGGSTGPADMSGSSSAGSAGSSSGSSGSGAASEGPLVVTQVRAGERDIPLDVDVTYSLDGPNVDRATIFGASGVVGVHIRVGERLLDGLAHDGSGDTAASSSRRFLVVFTVPTRVADDVTVSSRSVIGTQGSNTLIAAVVRVGEQVDCYMNATKFAMGPVAVVSASDSSIVSLLSAQAQAMGDGSAVFAQPGADGESSGSDGSGSDVAGSDTTGSAPAGSAASDGTSTASSASSPSSSTNRYQRLIDQLAKLRDLERSLATSEIAAKQSAYDKAFHAYMAAYVGSYTNHLSGSIGSSTQLTALMGTAGELSGDTPLAKAVLGEATATDALASAHQHTGAADAIDQVIRMVRAQGVDGLADTLKRRAGEEETEGAKEYSAGQSQLSQAMIPYSMAYTDTYTKHLSELTGGTSSGASAYRDQAIAATDKEFAAAGGAHAGDTAKVDAALGALAAARERTGAAAAYRQIVLRFADDLNGVGVASSADTGSSGSDLSSLMVAGRGLESLATAAGETSASSGSASGAGPSDSSSAGAVSVGSLAARAEIARLRRLAAAERRAASASSGDVTTTVIDESAAKTDASDVMKFAGAVPGAGKSGGSSSAGSSRSGDAASSGTRSGSGTASSESDDGAAASGVSGNGSSGTSTTSDSVKSSVSSAASTNRLSPYFGMIGMNPGAMLVVDTDGLINDTTTLADAGVLVAAALDQGADKLLPSSGSSGSTSPIGSSGSTSATRFLIVEPGL